MADPKDDIRTRLMATFRVEADEHVQTIRAHLLAVERGPAPAEAARLAEATFRAVHTLKGAARSVGLGDVETLCQACESLLSRVTRGQLALAPPLVRGLEETMDAVLRALDAAGPAVDVRAVVDRLERLPAAATTAARTAPAAAVATVSPASPAAEPTPSGATETIRLATAKVDALLGAAEDLLAIKLAAGERVAEARGLVEAVARLRTTRAAATHASLDDTRATAAVETSARALLARLASDERAVGTVAGAAQEQLRELRMMPAATALDRFAVMVRDLARAGSKEVEWVVRGAELEVDRQVLERVKDPLIHLVRNAVDHGIERPEARVAAGKPRQGRVALTITALEGRRLEIRVEDDGQGIVLARVRAAAVRARLLSEGDARALPDDEVRRLVFRSGLSTSPIVTAVSGHGLGLAIVQEAVERLDGQVRIDDVPGAGTTVRLELPATIATFRGLALRTGGRLFLMPIEVVAHVTRVPASDIGRIEGRDATAWNGRPLPLAWLHALLGIAPGGAGPAPDATCPCIVVASADEPLGLLVDEIVGVREVLVKAMEPPLARIRHVAGAGILGTTEVALILRPADLVRSARARAPAPPSARPETRCEHVVLVVDDSITTRTMEKNLLEAAGYRVLVAVDGVEAWTALRTEKVDLVVSDVDMPRMDGFELTARIRGDRGLAELPVVLVTALEAREDKERGIEVGANAYVVKSSFEQSNLLAIIQRLL